jgi:hypothetical protein
MRLIDHAMRPFNAIQRRVDAYATSPLNRKLDAVFHSSRQQWLANVDAAIGRGCNWFLPQADLTMSALYMLKETLLRSRDRRFSFIDDKIAHYRSSLRDPALRLFDKSYDPDTPAYISLPDIMAVRPYLPIELLMIDVVWADVRRDRHIVAKLAAIEDGGGYGTTHIVVGGRLLLENGGAPADDVKALLDTTVETMRGGNDATTYAGDLFAERVVMLQWLDRHDLVRPAWILRLLRRQASDGGWNARNVPPFGQSNQHTTALALAALSEFLRSWQAQTGSAPGTNEQFRRRPAAA